MNKYLIRLQTEINICDVLSDFSQYMFIPLEKRGFTYKEYAEKLYRDAEVYVAKAGNEDAGMIAFYCNDYKAYRAYLTSIVVKDIYQKSGIGAFLLGQMFRYCRKKKMKIIGLDVNLNNASAILFYTKYGFKKVKIEGESVYMEKNL